MSPPSASIIEPTSNNSHTPEKVKFLKTLEKYDQERDKRLRPDGPLQYIDLTKSDKFKHFVADPWYEPGSRDENNSRLVNQRHHRVLVVGTGFGGLLFAVRLIQSGQFTADDIMLVDCAGGFGGTWYWNRYPGLMCDVESYIYMPLLEETGYMPKEKYVSGQELREYADLIAAKWELEDRALFRTTVSDLVWEDDAKQWKVKAVHRRDTETEELVGFTADFIMLASGLLNVPRLADLPGIGDYQGHTFHTSRWDYEYTGGSLKNPKLSKLADKKVGIIGTGATAVQVVPQLARWAKELVVFQRTPSSIDRRDNRPTDPEWWEKEVRFRGAGWHRERMENFNAFITNVSPLPEVDLVSDGWTRMPSFSSLVGGPSALEPGYRELMDAVDFQRQEKIRSRAEEVVTNKDTADVLKPWYPGWCKRPCFHDEYLQAFNRPNVKLVDTQAKGVEQLTKTGIAANGEEYDLDLIIFGTGYEVGATASPAARGNMSITGRGGKNMEEKWRNKLATLHGVVTRDFPNLFFPGSSQMGMSANFLYVVDQAATHVAYMVREAMKRDTSADRKKVSIEPTLGAEESWTMETLMRARACAATASCTPGYINFEGALNELKAEQELIKVGRGSLWGGGIGDYVRTIEEWRSKGGMEGLEVSVE